VLAFREFEVLEPVFTPKPMAPDPQTIHKALTTPDTSEGTAAMDDEINNTHHLSIFKEVPCLVNENVIMPQWVFCCKFKNGTLIKYKA